MTTRVLVVDDNEKLLNVVSHHLVSLGFEVDSASKREEAEALLSHLKYSLVMVDLSLTSVGVEGSDLLKQIYSLTPRPKSIVLNGHSNASNKGAAIASSANLFIEKPCSMTLLGAFVRVVGDAAMKLISSGATTCSLTSQSDRNHS